MLHGQNVPSVMHCRHCITALYSCWLNYVALPLESIYQYDVPGLLKSEILLSIKYQAIKCFLCIAIVKAFSITAERSSSYLLSLLLFSHMVMSDSLWPQGLQHARLPCASPSLGICSNSCPSSWWCHPAITSSVIPFSSCLLSSVRVFSSESALHMRRPQYWSFSFSLSPSSKYSGLISFRIDWFDLFAVQGLFKSLLQHHSSKAAIV